MPDHSTFSKNRHGRFRDSNLLRELFEATVQRCMAEGLVGGEGFAADASLIKADANKQRSACSVGERSTGRRWRRAARSREYLDTLDEAAWGAATRGQAEVRLAADPAAQWTGALKGHAFFAYAANYLIDLDHAVIVDVEATPRDPAGGSGGAARTMIERTLDRFGSIPKGWRPTPPMARPRTWPGWCMSEGSSRISRCSTNPAHGWDLLARRVHL